MDRPTARRPYRQPELQALGSMSRVTRKTDKWQKPGFDFNDPQDPVIRRNKDK